jgi:hypothetical protein
MEQKRTSLGVGNLVIAIYAIFALSATVRAAYQLLRKFQDAPVAYSLSLVSGLIYVVATVALIRKDFRLARTTLVIELIGVLIVGSLSLLAPELFAHPSVWSQFGMGYGFIPLVLPIFGLWWLRRVSK